MITLSDALKDFVLGCQADGLVKSTITRYEYVIAGLVLTYPEKGIGEITAGDIRRYLVALRQREGLYGSAIREALPGKISDETYRSAIRALKRFFSWSFREYRLNTAHDPMGLIRLPPKSGQQPKAIALEDIRKLIVACDESKIGLRDKAMICFLTDTGCRAGGMLSLMPNNLFLDQGRALLTEKGDRTRAVPFTRYTADIIRAWLNVRPAEATTVFCGLLRRHYGKPLLVSGLNRAFKRLADKAGVTGRCNPHSFRHGFAREYLRNGGDLARLAQLMGHSTVNVTAEFYAIFKPDELARDHERLSPMRNVIK